MALLDNAFISEEQASALKKIGMSWEQFRDGQVFAGVKQLKGRKFHDLFCKEGNNICGGARHHDNSVDDIVARILAESSAPESKISKDNIRSDILASTTLLEKKANPGNSMEGGSCMSKSTLRAQGKGKGHNRVSQHEDSDILGVRKQDAMPQLTSREEDEILQEPEYSAGYDDAELPPMLSTWEGWHRITLQKGKSHVFLKLATWFLLRSRQLAKSDINAALDSVLIEGHPRDVKYDNDDGYYEALGMERMYSAIVNMEERPGHLAHLFHALGKSFDQSAVEASNPNIRPVLSPPTVVERYVNQFYPCW
ncbi:hypothetical protein AZE42_00729 [Rhizopogon vesiculosus]|uniref:Uncharacterized protein n=1 Tax=Rhizopogon vesiculosus TaxID=180088 RepID=A0A1J8QY94_9AGAM|nr:hypothetical protein AZE42_00729 [Rhizopogon vesiculosus]